MVFEAAKHERYFEDYVPGAVHEFGAIAVDENDVIEFATRFDPQSFHIDPIAARDSHFGGLIASGWHTCSMVMRAMVDEYLSTVASIGSPGVDEIRWLMPVRPGDTLSVRIEILDARPSQSKPDRGLVHSSIETLNQNGDIVMRMKTIGFFRRR